MTTEKSPSGRSHAIDSLSDMRRAWLSTAVVTAPNLLLLYYTCLLVDVFQSGPSGLVLPILLIKYIMRGLHAVTTLESNVQRWRANLFARREHKSQCQRIYYI